MNRNSIFGKDLSLFLEKLGCQRRNTYNNNFVYWSVYTGSHFVVPVYDEPLDRLTIDHIIWQLGLTTEAFNRMLIQLTVDS